MKYPIRRVRGLRALQPASSLIDPHSNFPASTFRGVGLEPADRERGKLEVAGLIRRAIVFLLPTSVFSLAKHEVVDEGIRDSTGWFVLGGQARQHVDRQRWIDPRT